MNLQQLLEWSEEFTDEVQTEGFALAFANQALSIINTELGLKLPLINSLTENYTALPESWFVRFLVSYLNFGVKMNDSSVNEALIYKQEFELALIKFRDIARTILDEDYIDDSIQSAYRIDTTSSIDLGWFNSGGGGW